MARMTRTSHQRRLRGVQQLARDHGTRQPGGRHALPVPALVLTGGEKTYILANAFEQDKKFLPLSNVLKSSKSTFNPQQIEALIQQDLIEKEVENVTKKDYRLLKRCACTPRNFNGCMRITSPKTPPRAQPPQPYTP